MSDAHVVCPGNFILGVFFGIAAVVAPVSVLADEQRPAEAPPAIADDAVLRSEADAIFNRALEKYRSAKSYRDRLKMTFHNVMVDPEGEEMDQNMTMELSVAVVAPDRLLVKSEQGELYCDGERLWAYLPQLEQYREHAAPKALNASAFDDDMMLQSLFFHPVAAAILQPDRTVWELFPGLKRITAVEKAERDAKPGTWVRAAFQAEMYGDVDVPLSLWFDAESGLLAAIQMDMTAAYRAMQGIDEDEGDAAAERNKPDPAGDDANEDAAAGDEEDFAFAQPKIKRAESGITFEDIQLDVEIPLEDFRFKPPADARKVSEFEMPGMNGGGQRRLVGKPAPAIEGEDFDGKPFKLADLKGSVVVMDFWATWCGPCVQAMPAIQKLSEDFAGKPVVVLGINRDHAGSEKQVLRFLDKKKITFRQIKDFDSDIGEAFSVTGIPCLVLVDREGVVQDITVGMSPASKKELADKIDRLLAGERLYDPAKLEALAAEDEDEDELPGDNGAGSQLEELQPHKLRIASKRSIPASYVSARADVDGDGAEEVLLPSPTSARKIHILSTLPDSDRDIKLEGAGAENVAALHVLQIDGRTCLFAALQKYGMMGSSSVLRLAAFDLTGTQQWTHSIKLPKKTHCSVVLTSGDLDGDGRPELVASLGLQKQTSSPSWTAGTGALVVLDSAGHPMSCKTIGRSASLVHVLPAADPSQPGVIVFGDYQRLWRLTYDQNAVPEAPAGPADGMAVPDVEATPNDASLTDDAEPNDEAARGCASNLRGLGQASLIYAHNNDGRLPAAFQDLIDDMSATPRQMRCPACDASRGLDACYTLVTGLTTEVDPDRILMYENAARHGDGAFVVRASGTVDYVRPYARVRELLARKN